MAQKIEIPPKHRRNAQTLPSLHAELSDELQEILERSGERGMTANEEERHDAIRQALPQIQDEMNQESDDDKAKIAAWKQRVGWTPDHGGQIDSETYVPPGRRFDPNESELFRGDGTPLRSDAMRDFPQPTATTGPGIGKRYADLFGRPKADEFSPEEFLTAIASSRFDPRLQRRAGHTLGVPSEGGFLSPELLSSRMLDDALEDEIVRPRATVYPMASETLKVPGVEVGDHSSSALLGGISGSWLGEDEAMNFEKAKLRMVKLQAHLHGILTSTSNVLDQDTMISDLIKNKFPAAMAWMHDSSFLGGDGSAKPLGILNDPALIAVNKETGQTAATILYENLIKMLARLHPALFRGAVWVANPTCIPQLLSITLGVGTAGVHFPALREDSGAWRMLTLPILFTEKLPTLGSQGDLMLVNFSQYLIGLRRDIAIDQSKHVLFDSNQTAFRVISRLDGAGAWNRTFQPANGDTMSWAVVLKVRS